MSVDPNLENQHLALKAQSMRYAQKVSPLLVMSGLLQEAMSLNQQLIAHADALRSELLKKKEVTNENGGAVQSNAPGEAAGEDRGGAVSPDGAGLEEEYRTDVERVRRRKS
jgi:hypothetical protein